MDVQKTIQGLEEHLSHFIISELCKGDPMKKGSLEMFKYKGLTITVDPKSKAYEKTIFIRVGVLEAEYRIDDCEKNSGCLAPEVERIIPIWLSRSEVYHKIKTVFEKKKAKEIPAIIPFDLEHFYSD